MVDVPGEGIAPVADARLALSRPLDHIGNYGLVTLGCGATLLFGLTPGGAYMATIALPFLVVWLPYQLIRAWLRPARRRALAIKLTMILVSVSAIVASQLWYRHASRRDADIARVAIQEYRSKHGAFPNTLAQAGIYELGARQRWGISYFDGNLLYRDVFSGWDTWGYNWTTETWDFHPD